MLYHDYMLRALRSLHVAEYVMKNTYPTIREPKLLLAVLEDIHISHLNLIKAVLSKNRHPIDGGFVHLFSVFKSLSIIHGFTDEDFDLVFRVHKILHDHENCDVEFPRKDKFIICLDGYRLEPVTVEDVNEYIFKSKHLLQRFESLK